MNQAEQYPEMIAETITRIRQHGETPTNALLHVAQAHDLPPHAVEFIAGQVNTSRALVHLVKTAGAERLQEYPLADADAVVKLRGKKMLAKETPAISVKIPDTKPAVRKCAASEATAEEADTTQDVHALQRALRLAYGQASVLCRAAAASTQKSLTQDIGQLVRTVKKLASSERVRLARRVVNRYGDFGTDMMKHVWHTAGVEEVIPEKSGSGAVFPPEEPYLTVDRIIKKAQDASVFESNADLFGGGATKSVPFLPDSALMFAPTPVRVTATLGRTLAQDDQARPNISFGTRAQLENLRVRKVFMDAILGDPALRGYPLRRLVRAFNDSVQNEPRLTRNPSQLRASMQQMLSASSLDPFTLKTFADMAQVSAKTEKLERERAKMVKDAYEASKGKEVKRMRDLREAAQESRDAAGRDAAQAREESWKKFKGGLAQAGQGFGKVVQGIQGVTDYFKEEIDKAQTAEEIDKVLDTMAPEDLRAAQTAAGVSSPEALRRVLVRSLEGKEPKGSVLGQSLDRGTRAAAGVNAVRAERAEVERARTTADAREARVIDSYVNEFAKGLPPRAFETAADTLLSDPAITSRVGVASLRALVTNARSIDPAVSRPAAEAMQAVGEAGRVLARVRTGLRSVGVETGMPTDTIDMAQEGMRQKLLVDLGARSAVDVQARAAFNAVARAGDVARLRSMLSTVEPGTPGVVIDMGGTPVQPAFADYALANALRNVDASERGAIISQLGRDTLEVEAALESIRKPVGPPKAAGGALRTADNMEREVKKQAERGGAEATHLMRL